MVIATFAAKGVARRYAAAFATANVARTVQNFSKPMVERARQIVRTERPAIQKDAVCVLVSPAA